MDGMSKGDTTEDILKEVLIVIVNEQQGGRASFLATSVGSGTFAPLPIPQYLWAQKMDGGVPCSINLYEECLVSKYVVFFLPTGGVISLPSRPNNHTFSIAKLLLGSLLRSPLGVSNIVAQPCWFAHQQ